MLPFLPALILLVFGGYAEELREPLATPEQALHAGLRDATWRHAERMTSAEARLFLALICAWAPNESTPLLFDSSALRDTPQPLRGDSNPPLHGFASSERSRDGPLFPAA